MKKIFHFLKYSPRFRPLRKTLWHSFNLIVAGKRWLLGQTNTWWDNQNYSFMRNGFLRDPVDGITHPSRVWIRNWLTRHPNLTFLDIPCGTGVEYEGFVKYQTPVKYIGMDYSDTMVKIFSEYFPQADVRKGNILNIPLPDKSVDVVLCRAILEHLEDYHPAVKEAIRVARRVVFLVLFKLPSKTEVRKLGWGAWDNRLDAKELKLFLNQLGVRYAFKKIPYPKPVRIEENTIIQIGVS